MRSSLPSQVGIALAALTIGFVALESKHAVDDSQISITGGILVNGQPLKSGTVRFFSEGTPQPACDVALVRNGEYTISGSETLVPAVYEVRISSLEGNEKPEAHESLPSRYNSQSVIRVRIKKGGNHRFNFDLKL